MTNQEAVKVFNAAREAAAADGNREAAARIELAREYFTNPEFRKALEAFVWELNQ